MAKTVCKLLGLVLLIAGICGFFAPTLLGAHLNMAHNMVHIVSGAIALYFGFAGSAGAARGFCLLFGLVYLLLGVCGWFLGTGAEHMFNIPNATSAADARQDGSHYSYPSRRSFPRGWGAGRKRQLT